MIKRRFIKEFSFEKLDVFNFSNTSKTLIDWIFELDKILVLADAGMGKTTEFNTIADELWEIKEESGYVPVLLDLKKFDSNTQIKDFILYEKWEEIDKVILIMDGLDESGDYEEFINKLESFSRFEKKNKIKYVISCRLNFFSEKKNLLNEYQKLYFDSINVEDAIIHLKENGVNVEILEKNKLNDPFYINMIIHFKNNPDFINSKIKTLEKYLTSKIEKDIIKVEKMHLSFTVSSLLDLLKSIAFKCEIKKKSFFLFKDIIECSSEYNAELIINNSSLIDKNDDNKWSFLNKQFQEFLAALKMADMELGDLYEVIFIKDTNKVKLHLFNTIGFLLNLIEEDKKQAFYKIIEKNNSELFFNVESSHLEEPGRNRIFQSLFKKYVEENGLWLAYAIGVDESKIGNFSKTYENYNFLIEKIKSSNKDISILNAIHILKYHNLSIDTPSIINEILEKQCKKESKNIISEIIDLAYNKSIEIVSENISSIININDTHINTNLLLYLGSQSDEIINGQISFIEKECDYYLGNLYREDTQNYMNFHWALLSICCKLNKSNILKVSKLFFNHDLAGSVADKPFFDKYINKLVEYINRDIDFLYILLDMYIKNRYCELEYFYNSGFNEILTNSKKIIESIDYIENTYLYESELYYDLLIKLINDDTKNKIFNLIINTKNDDLIKNKFSLHFPRFIDEKYIKDYYTFLDENGVNDYFKIKFQQDFDKEKDALLIKYQSDFDKISNEEMFRKLLNQFILDYNITEVNRDILYNLIEKHNYYELKNNIIYNYLDFLVKNGLEINLESYDSEILIKQSSLFIFIFTQVRDSNEKLNCSNHLDFLKKHTAHIVSENKFLDFKSNESNNYFKAFLYFLTKKIVSVTEASYLLNLIKYAENGENGISLFNFVLNRKIVNSKSFDEKVLENLTNNELFVSVKIEHIEYCLENKIVKSYELIKNILLVEDNFFVSKLLNKYFIATKDLKILELFLSKDPEYQFSSIHTIIDNQVKDLYEKVTSICLKNTENNKENIELFSIICLLKLNHEKALSKFLFVLKNYPNPNNLYWYDIQNSFEKFNNEKEIEILKDFFELDFSKFRFFPIHYLLSQYLANIIEANKDNYDIIKEDLEKIKLNHIDSSKLFQISNVIIEFEKKYLEILSR